MNVISISNYFARNPLSSLNTIHTFPTENCPRSNQVSHLLSQSSLEEIWSLRQKEDAERSRATEGGLFSCAPHGNKNTEAMKLVLWKPISGWKWEFWGVQLRFGRVKWSSFKKSWLHIQNSCYQPRILRFGPFKTCRRTKQIGMDGSKSILIYSLTRPIPNLSWNLGDSWISWQTLKI